MSNTSIPQTGLQQDRAREQEAKEQEKQQKQQEKEREENRTPKRQGPLQTSHGVTTIDEVVVAKIAGMAAREVPGVYDMGNAVRRAFSAVTDRIPNAQTNVAGGISVEKGETQAAVDVTVVVEYGASIVEVGNAIRRNIVDQVQGATGLEVIEVNVNVTDVHLPEDDSNSGSANTASTSSARGELK
ncbi:Asp23/Gls24 family envelope stress response protein [Naumannella sp. ID2617S]|nr:Asp23/Gls24 family envelope stress response protein [Naumannella sp. ID2617S]